MKTFLKNTSLIAIGAILASTAALYAATIEANINSFTQYIQQLFVTSDGTPTGDPVFTVNGSGEIENERTATNGSTYVLGNIADGLGPNTQFVGMGGVSGSQTNIVGIVDILGFNQTLLNSVNDATGQESFYTSIPGRISMGNQINLNPINTILMQENGINIDILNTGEFVQTRHDFKLINTPELLGQVPFAGSTYTTGSQTFIAGVADLFGSPLAILEYFDNGMPIAYVGVGSGVVTIEAVGNSIFINENGVRINNQYTLPSTDGAPGQVLTTDGNGNLYRSAP